MASLRALCMVMLVVGSMGACNRETSPGVPPGSGSPPIARFPYAIRFDPPDLSSALGNKLPRIVVSPHLKIDDTVLSRLAAGVSLETHPEGERVPFVAEEVNSHPVPSSQIYDSSAPQPYVEVRPTVALERRWYRIRLQLPDDVQPNESGSDLRVSPTEALMRFRLDSEPRLRRISFCPKEKDGVPLHVVTIDFSELLAAEQLYDSPLAITQGARSCEPMAPPSNEPAPGTPEPPPPPPEDPSVSPPTFVSLWCYGFDPGRPWTLSVRLDEVEALQGMSESARAVLRADLEVVREVVPNELPRGLWNCPEYRK